MKNFLKLFSIVLLFALASCDKKCDNTCAAGEVLAEDCTCIKTDPCANVTCDAGFACSNGNCVSVNEVPTVRIDRNVTSNETWTKDKIYILARRVTVTSGATLTIQAGTVIKGEAGSGANATALLVARGAKLVAEGTAASPGSPAFPPPRR